MKSQLLVGSAHPHRGAPLGNSQYVLIPHPTKIGEGFHKVWSKGEWLWSFPTSPPHRLPIFKGKLKCQLLSTEGILAPFFPYQTWNKTIPLPLVMRSLNPNLVHLNVAQQCGFLELSRKNPINVVVFHLVFPFSAVPGGRTTYLVGMWG